MEKSFDDQELDIPAVFEVIGEPAIVINGVPDMNQGDNLEVSRNAELDDDLYFGDWMEGRSIQKLFGGQYYSGKVESYDSETNWYRVIYEDGDFEDLERHELEEVLLPLDISIPLPILALHRCKPERSFAMLPRKVDRGRKSHKSHLQIKEKTSELLQICQLCEPSDAKPMETDLRGSTYQEISQLQNGLQSDNRETCFQTCKYDKSSSMLQGSTIPSNICNGNESNSANVFEVIGEPAIVINGVPDATPGGISTILGTKGNPEQGDDVCFGELLEGRKVKKLFGHQYYSGKVEKFDEETNWYKVVYEDGDFEDLEWHELEDLLIPLDISVPLRTLALHRCKFKKHVSEPQAKVLEGRENHTNNVGNMIELIHASQMGEQRDKKLVESNVSKGTDQGHVKAHKGLCAGHAESCLQMSWCEASVSNPGEGTTTSKINLNGEAMGMILNPFQTPQRVNINGDGLVLGDAHKEASVQESLKRQRNFLQQSVKTARAEKQRRKDCSFVQSNMYHSG